ncbi:MAG: hypothetical protein JNL11_19265 [Bdellovibrionaceae bacterium]|nr:hypothetical protein [Pseudobdellovibrionaceae bacterium]
MQNWDMILAQFTRKVKDLNPLQDREFDQLIFQFASSTVDAHVSYRNNSNYSRELPFQMTYTRPDGGEGVYHINWVAEGFPSNVRKPKPLDQVLAIENLSVEQYRNQFDAYKSDGKDEVDRSLFAQRIVSMSEAGGMPLQDMNPNGLRLKLKDKDSGDVYEILVPYTEKGTPMISRNTTPLILKESKDLNKPTVQIERNIDKKNKRDGGGLKDGERPFRESKLFKQNDRGEGRRVALGDKNTLFELPKDAVEITFPMNETIRQLEERMRNADPLNQDPLNRNELKAYVFNKEVNGKTMRVGFLRIPSYSPSNVDTIIYRLRHVMAEMNQRSDMLVIDQMNNPGGAVSYSNAVIRNLVPQIKKENLMEFLVRPTRSWVQRYSDTISRFENNLAVIRLLGDQKYNALLADLKLNNERIIKAYQAENGFSISEGVVLHSLNEAMQIISDATLIGSNNLLYGALMSTGLGSVFLKDQPYNAEKPVYFLINEKDFSGGDATPADFQDQQRGKIVGIGATHTAGAGGTVESFEIPGYGRISITASLMHRPAQAAAGNHKYAFVEKVGISADHTIWYTAQDQVSGFKTVYDKLFEYIGKDLQAKTPNP